MATEKVKFETVDQYIASFPEDIRQVLSKVRQTILKAVPGTEEVISYQIPAYKYEGVWIIGFAAYAQHFSLTCPPPGTVFEAFREELSAYKQSKSAIQFPYSQPAPLKLIGQIAKFRMKEGKALAQEKAAAKTVKKQTR